MKKLVCAATVGAFFFLLGIVGAVEHGAALSLMWWAVPAMIVMIGGAIYAKKI